ncbi:MULTISPECIES: restriction endonuclease subunit S [Psychrobacter]|uniref:restriction endonuclease subunit S n=1 Tax=Psychrobacter TaxID=497 RepID=UPI001917EFC7|nr:MULTISPECIES: restriction endonuclease subunit S [Psychrobacter]MDN3502113.1 restriction endonuclease subunit S [Psychrobacter sp. 5A.1]
MAKYEQYEEYKPTGVIWIPEMPQGWQVTKLKYLIKNLESGVSVNAADYPKSEGEFGVLKTSCVYTREFRAEENKTVFEEELSRVKCPVRAGSIIISRMNTPDLVGAAVYVKEDYSNLYLPDRLWQTVYNDEETQSSKYLHYFMYLKGFRDQISNFAEGASSSMQSIAKEDFLSINILLPTRVEQEGIANFLDYETAQIDTLIEKQQTLIQLLKEKRQAVISHAVTKGLNPDVPMKDSGVEWLGEVPEHWTVSFVKYIVLGAKDSMVDGPFGSSVNTSEDYVDDGIPVIRTVNITNNGFSSDNLKFMRQQKFEQLKRHSVKPGDVLFSKVGTIGNACLLPSDIPEAILSTTGSCKVSVDQNKIEGEYLVLMFHLMNQTLMEMANSNVQPFLNMSNIKNLKISLPSIEEQKNILTYLEEKLEGIDDLISKSLSFDKLIRERRTALISAAVTGKIDVRGWQAPE